MALVLLDTNIVIDFFAGLPAAGKEVAAHEDIAISAITYMEVMVGVMKESTAVIARTKAQLELFTVYDIQVGPLTDRAIAARSVTIKSNKKKLSLPDAIILATAQVHGRILLTRNTKDFPKGTPGVYVPYEITIQQDGTPLGSN
jgi:predicted nucleic acid-binding protein